MTENYFTTGFHRRSSTNKIYNNIFKDWTNKLPRLLQKNWFGFRRGNSTEPIWRVLASFNGISSWTPLKPQHSIPCWQSVQWEPSACRSCQCCQKKGIIKSLWVDLLCLAFLGLGEPALSHWKFCLFVSRYYLPTPPLGQDMTQGQFLSGV